MSTKVFAVGRFNPPTLGHEEMIKAVLKAAREHGDRYPRIYVTRTHDSKKNPLDVGKKLAYLRAAFPGIDFRDTTNIIEAIGEINADGVKHPILVAGTDRIPGYDKMMKVGIEGGHTNFDDYKLISLTRDPDADNASGASATKARQYAADGDLEKFKSIAPSKLSDEQKESLFNAVREGMGVK